MYEITELADDLDDMPSPRQAEAWRKRFRRQHRRPLSMVMFDIEKDTKLCDLKADLIGYKVDYRLYTGLHLVGGCEPDGASGCASLVGFAMDFADDCAPPAQCAGSQFPQPECLDGILGKIGILEDCSAKSTMAVSSPPMPAPQAGRSSLGKRTEKQQRQDNRGATFRVMRRRLDPLQEIALQERPMFLRHRIRKRKRAYNHWNCPLYCDCQNTDVVPSMTASLWMNEIQRPYLFSGKLLKQEMVLPGGERFLWETMKELKAMAKEKNCSLKAKELERRANDVKDAAAASDVAAAPDMPGLPLLDDSSDRDSYRELLHSHLLQIHNPFTECQLSDLQKRVAKWEIRIRPLLDIEEERESFNILTYCSRMLDHFSDTPSKQTLHFRQVSRGQPIWEVSRYFASTLQLANDYNVQLDTDGVMEEGMDTLRLTLLSRKQHFDEPEELDSHISLTASQASRKRKQQVSPGEPLVKRSTLLPGEPHDMDVAL